MQSTSNSINPATLDHEQAVAAYLAACKLLQRCLPIITADAQMMADITRHAPLDPVSQAAHDSTEYESEKLMREIPTFLASQNIQNIPLQVSFNSYTS